MKVDRRENIRTIEGKEDGLDDWSCGGGQPGRKKGVSKEIRVFPFLLSPAVTCKVLPNNTIPPMNKFRNARKILT